MGLSRTPLSIQEIISDKSKVKHSGGLAQIMTKDTYAKHETAFRPKGEVCCRRGSTVLARDSRENDVLLEGAEAHAREQDHKNAKRLAEGGANLKGVKIDLATVQTNIVIFDV